MRRLARDLRLCGNSALGSAKSVCRRMQKWTHLPVDGPLRALMGAATWARLTKPHLVAAPIKARSDFTPGNRKSNVTVNPQMRPAWPDAPATRSHQNRNVN